MEYIYKLIHLKEARSIDTSVILTYRYVDPAILFVMCHDVGIYQFEKFGVNR